VAIAHKQKDELGSTGGKEKTKCPKCGSRNTLVIGEYGDKTFSCLDCLYTEGIGIG